MKIFKRNYIHKHLEDTYGITFNEVIDLVLGIMSHNKYIDIIDIEVNLYTFEHKGFISIHPEDCKNHNELFEKIFHWGLHSEDNILNKKCRLIKAELRNKQIDEILN